MEISEVKRHVLATVERARRSTVDRRTRNDAAERDYAAFLDTTAVPLFRQVGNVLRAEGFSFSVITPGGSVRLTSDRNAEDYVEVTLVTDGAEPVVQGHASRRWGRGVIESEEALGTPSALGEHELLEFVLKAIEPFVGR